jgi:hypothetical protein
MIITDMRMENEAAGTDVIQAARSAPYHPAVALLTAFPVDEEGWDGAGPDKILVKATQTKILLQQIEKLFAAHAAKLSKLAAQAAGNGASANGQTPAKAKSIGQTTASSVSKGRNSAVPTASLADLAASGDSTPVHNGATNAASANGTSNLKSARPAAKKISTRSAATGSRKSPVRS